VHPAGISLDGRVDKVPHLAEIDDLFVPVHDLTASHPHDRAVQEHVLSAREFRMKSRPHFEQASQPPPDIDLSFARGGDTTEQLQQRALARTGSAYHANGCTTSNVEPHTPDSPKL